MSKTKNYRSFKYYGRLRDIKDVLEVWYDRGEEVICCNGIQGQAAIDLLNKIKPHIVEGFVDIDTETDHCDTLFIEIKKNHYSVKEVLAAIIKVRPNEFHEGDGIDNQYVFRIWWD